MLIYKKKGKPTVILSNASEIQEFQEMTGESLDSYALSDILMVEYPKNTELISAKCSERTPINRLKYIEAENERAKPYCSTDWFYKEHNYTAFRLSEYDKI